MTRKNGQRLIVPKREPLAPPDEQVQCDIREECEGCTYPRHGFICHYANGGCLKTSMDEIMPPLSQLQLKPTNS